MLRAKGGDDQFCSRCLKRGDNCNRQTEAQVAYLMNCEPCTYVQTKKRGEIQYLPSSEKRERVRLCKKARGGRGEGGEGGLVTVGIQSAVLTVRE